MTKLTTITAALLILAMSRAAIAGGTATVTVNANVVAVCQVTSVPTITLTMDPTTTGPATATGNIFLWCTKGTAFTVKDPSGNSTGTYNTALVGNDAATGNSGQTIPFTLTYNTGGTGAGRSTAINSFVTATVLNTNFVNATTGTYTKTIVMNIMP